MILGGAISGYSTAELNGTRIERGEKWEVGVEPTTLSFTHSCSTVELLPTQTNFYPYELRYWDRTSDPPLKAT